MDTQDQETLALRFNEGINRQDAELLADLMTDDHCFVDSAHNAICGKAKALQAWSGFFAAFPDYRNVFETATSTNDMVLLTGHSLCSDKRLDGRALWTAKIRGNKIAEWRVYEDTPENRRRLGHE